MGAKAINLLHNTAIQVNNISINVQKNKILKIHFPKQNIFEKSQNYIVFKIYEIIFCCGEYLCKLLLICTYTLKWIISRSKKHTIYLKKKIYLFGQNPQITFQKGARMITNSCQLRI